MTRVRFRAAEDFIFAKRDAFAPAIDSQLTSVLLPNNFHNSGLINCDGFVALIKVTQYLLH
jgi:hypothetical protein